MKVRYAALALLGTLCVRGVWAQSFGQVANDKQESEFEANEERGFTAQVDIDVNLFQFTQERFSDAKQRNTNNKRIDKDYITNYPFGGFNILDDTNVTFGYNGDWYGGKLTVNSGGLGGIKAWAGFFENKLKISAGNDIGYGYADSQGADAGLRVYDDNVRIGKDDGYTNAGWETVDSNKNPDNISQDKGILLEFDLAPLKIALAGGG
ncbi:MAG: hypothetical protein LBC72_01505, partial [Spirochaetaceae bacterium]|nr:hypothetical protein [Spirochaetaceae bacterium]